MKVYLLNPPFKPNFVRCGRWQGASARSGGLDYPKWLAYTAGMLEKDHNVKLVDAVAQGWTFDMVNQDVKAFSPDVIIAETNFSSLSNDIKVLKNLPSSAVTVMVGPPVHLFYEKILNSGIRVAVPFEFEWVVADLVGTLERKGSFDNVNGIVFKKRGELIKTKSKPFSSSTDLNELPFVSKVYKKYLPIERYFLSQSLYPEVQIFAGRGCPSYCTFCSWPENMTGRVYRMRDPENLVDEFEYIKKELPFVKEVFIEDDTFTVRTDKIEQFCNELMDRKLNVVWSCNARATLNYSVMRQMKKAGCRLIIVGYESGSDHILKKIKKGNNIGMMKKFTADAKRAGLLIHGDFIVGLPNETVSTIKETERFIHEIKPNVLQVAIATPIPGTAFYEYAKNNGYLMVDTLEKSIDSNGYQKCVINYPELTNDEIEYWANHILKGYYLSPSYLPVAVKNVARATFVDEMKVMLRSARTFLSYVKIFK
ncbi:MAG: B12-binding domain-containing radical SAM protein [Candidatus Bathyarchaeota archaeon]|nr:B12-binding domain-containing radical SAM protein [Candidatus Bathyarchaeota archaeon]